MIKIYNRIKKDYDIEKVAGEGFLDVLYNTRRGKAGLELLIKRKVYSALMGFVCDTGISAGKIAWFVKEYGIDMSICRDKIEDFKCFNDFFIRKLKPEARIFDPKPELLLSPGDGRLKAWMNIDTDSLVQIKGLTYSLKELLGSKELADRYSGGICMILRLAPVDYHRFHFIDEGVCSESKKVKGSYYSVNPTALNSIPQVFCRNKREYSILDSVNFGKILYVEVGATSVGSIVQTYKPFGKVARGAEKGYFKFGGSTVILFMEKGTAGIDEDILEQTEKGYEVRVLAGDTIGSK